MLTFVIPVKSKSVASDWTNFSQIFERTLKSICNQTDSNFRIVVVCHEIPDISYTHKNLYFVHPDFGPPIKGNTIPQEYFHKQRIDKGNKIKLGVAFASKKFNTDYVMLVDSDDFISNRIVAFVNNSGNDLPGWYIGKGYLSFKWKNFMVVTTRFNRLCGSCVIVKPNLVRHFFDEGEINIYFNHFLTTLDSNIELKKVPFPAGIYNIGNGENIFMSFQNVVKINNHGNWISAQSFKRLWSKIRNYRVRFITPGLRKEFNFYLNAEEKYK
ncbi:glycosyltransferase family A protein [Flagellimonas flava]|uniref:Glycosyl transferase family 2 n=1 Tax=Flagellimonas flava TaxID=570519 RepID=A0A1M5JZ62_9FLAO|nr:glycosyltransferase family A protein [Allomuricauda flava]SHG45824.1 hypothetical protein SAMN04488116_1299 [Allomuricauda flava]